MFYEKFSCPSCGETFGDSADIVVCPVCGTPHHRDCWNKTGKCVNESLHAEGFVWTAPEIRTEEKKEEQPDEEKLRITCPDCGATCSANALVCPDCGHSFSENFGSQFVGAQPFAVDDAYFMHGVKADPEEDIDGIKAKDAAVYVRIHAGKYVPRFIKMSKTGKKISWNWSAFLISPYWFFYRKMYKIGAAFIGMTLIVTLFASVPVAQAGNEAYDTIAQYVSVTETTTTQEIIDSYEALSETEQGVINGAIIKYSRSLLLLLAALAVPNLCAALIADEVYKTKVVREVTSMRKYSQNDQTFKMLALRRGGVSALALFLSYLVYSGVVNLILYI